MKRILKLRTKGIPIKELDLRKEKMRLGGRTKEKLLGGKAGRVNVWFVYTVATLAFIRMVQKRK